jgi:rare lipoprotein A
LPTIAPAPLSRAYELVDSPGITPPAVDFSLSSKPRPALLDGETAREFERGSASWYGGGFHGRRTASGERFDMYAMTAAHRTLPFGTLVRVHSLVNGRDVEVRITDRGPFSRGRVIDVSRAAAQELGMLGMGFKEVVLSVPESVQPVAEVRPAVIKKRRQVGKRSRPLPSR